MTTDTLYDTEPDQASTYASVSPFARGIPVMVKAGLVVPIDKIEEAVLYLKKTYRTVDLIQVYIYKYVLRASMECDEEGAMHYAWDDLMVTHCKTNTGTWEILNSQRLELECPGVVQPEERVAKYRAVIHEQHEERKRAREALARGVLGVVGVPTEEGEPN